MTEGLWLKAQTVFALTGITRNQVEQTRKLFGAFIPEQQRRAWWTWNEAMRWGLFLRLKELGIPNICALYFSFSHVLEPYFKTCIELHPSHPFGDHFWAVVRPVVGDPSSFSKVVCGWGLRDSYAMWESTMAAEVEVIHADRAKSRLSSGFIAVDLTDFTIQMVTRLNELRQA